MITAKDVIEKIEDFAPLSGQEEYDNSGLTAGDEKSAVSGIFITLDVDEDAIRQAKRHNCNFILSHHPLIFEPVKSLNLNNYQTRVIALAIKENMTVYAAHTSADNAENSIAHSNLTDIGARNIYNIGELFIGDIQETTVENLAAKFGDITLENGLKYTFKNKSVKKAGHINGSGGRMSDILPVLTEHKVDVFISSEFKYSFLRELYYNSIAVIESNHYNGERAFLKIMKNILSKDFDNVVVNEVTGNPYQKE